jgi:hypothetical protein
MRLQIVLSLCWIASLTLHAQKPQVVDGLVEDPSGAVVTRARVVIKTPGSTKSSSSAADNGGRFQITLPPGTHTVCVSGDGFVENCKKVSVGSKPIKSLFFRLKIAAESALLSSRVLDDALRATAGGESKNCGHVTAVQNPSKASRCVLSQLAQKRAFLVRYDLQGIDSEVAIGYAGNGTSIRTYLFDSFGTLTEGQPVNLKSEFGRRLVSLPCSKTVEPHLGPSGRISCLHEGNSDDWLQ